MNVPLTTPQPEVVRVRKKLNQGCGPHQVESTHHLLVRATNDAICLVMQ